MKLLTFSLLAASLSLSPLAASAAHSKTSAPHKVILHAWSWSFNTIADNMRNIAAAGYDFVQTSPAQACYVGDNGGMALFSEPGDSIQGKWYYYYQPTDWTIGNYMLGNRDEFKAMCDSAYKYNVKILVDVLPNHTAVDHTAVLPGLDNAVGGHENLFHANGFKNIELWNDRYECTTGMMGGLPDVNTENPDFQYYYMQYVNELINLGARGFRYDTAKHIGLPSDPLDAKSKVNNFWPIATGREAVKSLSLLMPDSLFIYGEVLQDKNIKEAEYAEYIGQTASAYGQLLRDALAKQNFNNDELKSWNHPVDASKLVTWVESHDTYCNANESASLSDDQIKIGWVLITSRKGGTPLFFSRPAGSSKENVWGHNRIGERGNDSFFNPEVVAINEFRHKMADEDENISISKDGSVVIVSRGNKGFVVLNFTEKPQKVKMETALQDGEYTDNVFGNKFKVKNGILIGKIEPLKSYIIYNNL
ncbi:MAG: alpha-amylase family protein [Bacteroidales bacterium]|nr:alpha-amylase family protein [Bacteroidales bacterium]